MKIRDVGQAAQTIADHYGQEDFQSTIDKLTFRNAMLVIVTDFQGNVLMSSDEHAPGGPFGNPRRPGSGTQRPLPPDYASFVSLLEQSRDGTISYTATDTRHPGKSLVYGMQLPNAALYISTPLDPVNATTDILRTQLLYVTIVALLLSLLIAWFLSRKVSTPVQAITHQAAELATGNYTVTFVKGFCTELDNLALMLDQTARELSKVEHLRQELIANVSHDLRTPLTMVKAYAEMIRDISGNNTEKREAHLAIIIAEADRLAALVNDILDLSMMQSGNHTPALEHIDLSHIVRQTIARFAPIFQREGCILQATIEPHLYVHGDEPTLTQALYNLIANALNYIGNDQCVIVTLSDLDGWVRCEITDHGTGIPEDELPQIWERYYKAKEHRRSKTGTGLGLSIVRSILESHHARYGVESVTGEGSMFWFELRK